MPEIQNKPDWNSRRRKDEKELWWSQKSKEETKKS